MGRIGCPETSVNNYNDPLRNFPEQFRSRHCQLLSLQGRIHNKAERILVEVVVV